MHPPAAIGLGLVLLVLTLPHLYLRRGARGRTRCIQQPLPDFLDELTLTLESGMGKVRHLAAAIL